MASVKQMIDRNEVNSINWLTADKQLADSLTKHGASVKTLVDVIENGHFSKLF